MFPTQFTITNLSTSNVIIDTKFNEDRSLRRNIARGSSLTLTPADATLEELDANAQIQALIAAGDISVTMTNGPLVGFTYAVAADAGTSADTLTIQAAMPFAIQLVQVQALVPTGVATSTVTLASAASGGTDYTGTIDTDGTPGNVVATLAALAVPKGGALVLNRSATAKAALTLQVVGIRTSI